MKKIDEIFIKEFMGIIEGFNLDDENDFIECKDRIQSYLGQYDYLIKEIEI